MSWRGSAWCPRPRISRPGRERRRARSLPRSDPTGVERRRLRRRGSSGSACRVACRRSSLSKGQRRQLALAAALAAEPEVLILDDPTLGLDAVVRRTLLEELVGELADRGTTVLVTTHDLTGIEGIADRVGIMQQGRLVYDETMEGLKDRFRRLRCVRGAYDDRRSDRSSTRAPRAGRGRLVGAGVDAVVGRADDAAVAEFTKGRRRHRSRDRTSLPRGDLCRPLR